MTTTSPPAAITDSRTAGWDALAADGSIVHFRPVRSEDEPALYDLDARVSEQTIYRRFFAMSRRVADEYMHYLTTVGADDGRVALIAETAGRIVAVGSYEPLRPGEAEVAFLVDDTYHGRGLGTLLLEQLAAIARERGIHHLHADTLVENAPMLRVFADSGFEQVRTLSSGVVELSVSTTVTDGAGERIAEREREAERRSLEPLLAPRSVAVIGAGRTAGGVGHEVLLNLVAGEYTGRLFAVNPQAGEVAGVRCYPSVTAVPGPVDLAVVAVPAGQVEAVVTECAEAGVAGAVVLSSGFGEVGEDGRARQAAVVRTARAHGMRLIGPNCLGIVNTDPAVRLDATFAEVRPVPGTLALASQSGAVGIAVLDHASRAGVGISQFVSLGNKADVSGNDLLLHWWSDPRAEVIGLYLESFGNPRKFGRLARLVGRAKPVLVVKGGRSGGGRRAGASHTAAAATPDTAVDALFAQAGVLRMDTVEELVDTAQVLAGQPLPSGRRLGVVGNAGGAGVLAADAAEAIGLAVPELSAETAAAIGGSAVTSLNPVDLGAAAGPDAFGEAVRVLRASGEVDAVLVVFAATRAGNVDAVRAAISSAAAGAGVPVLVNCLGAPDAGPLPHTTDGRRLPVFSFPEGAVRALGHAVRYAEWRQRPLGVVPSLERVDAEAARNVVQAFLRVEPAGGWLDPAGAADLLDAAGIAVVPVRTAHRLQQALRAADQLGYPVALKTAGAVLHKTDLGGVRTGIRGPRQLRRAYEAVTAAVGDPRVVVQPMAPAGVELVAGLVRDPQFGPVLMVGSGGVLTDLLADRRWRGLPLTDLDAAEMVRSLRCAPLLAGYRGGEPADEAAVLDTLHRLARLAELVGEIAELDVNPLIASPLGAFAVDVKVRIAPAAIEQDPHARRLR